MYLEVHDFQFIFFRANASKRKMVQSIESMVKHSIAVLQSLAKEIAAFCSQEKSSMDIRSSMNTLFRAILLLQNI